MTRDFLDGMIAVLIPSVLCVAWMVWREDEKIPSRDRGYNFSELGEETPNKLGGARSCQFGRASAPIAPHTVQTMRGPKAGTASPSAKAPTSNITS